MCWRISAERYRGLELPVLVQRDPQARQPARLFARAPGVASAGNPVDRCWLSRAGCHADPDDGLLAAVVVDHHVAGLHQAHQVVAGGGYASAGCRRGLEVRADVIAAGYLHPHVLAGFALPPVTRPVLGALSDGRRKSLRQAARVSWLEAWHANAEPDALGGITALGRIRCLRDLGLRCPQAAPQGLRVRFQREPDRRLDESAVCLGQAQVLGVPRVNQRIDQNRIELAQPGEQDCQRPVVVRVPWCPAARTAAAAFHDESEMAAISFDEILGIHDTAAVINQTHESQTPTQRWVMSRTTLRRLTRK